MLYHHDVSQRKFTIFLALKGRNPFYVHFQYSLKEKGAKQIPFPAIKDNKYVRTESFEHNKENMKRYFLNK